MSIRVVARIRPLLENELDKDVIVRADSVNEGQSATLVKIPNPKNEAEEFSFAFNGVYDQETSQEELFSAEIASHMKALFQGLDVTIFAYGVTGTGKTHTMRGGMKLAERGVIPRLLSNVFRRGKKIVKDSDGETTVDVSLSYYEIYNDKVFDLLEPPEKRTPSGLPLRDNHGKTVVVGLSERVCSDLKDFEKLYIEANANRVTAATKLNAHSSRSHAIIRVKVTQTTGDTIRESTASAIDLAGSEDNRRTDNGKERLVESAAINKSLFVLSQCIDAISRGDKRIPYRESKMTRILSLGQNQGITVMILNLAPIRSYHLDTLSSLNVSSRAKRIEVREIENEIVFKQQPRSMAAPGGMARQPLRLLTNAHNVASGMALIAKEAEKEKDKDKPIKAFSVYTDRAKVSAARAAPVTSVLAPRKPTTNKRPSDHEVSQRPSKLARPTQNSVRSAPALTPAAISEAQIEAMVEKKVAEILAARAAATLDSVPTSIEPPRQEHDADTRAHVNEAVERRLEALERRIETAGHDDTRSPGLRLLLQARQAKERGDDHAALQAYESALPFFPGQVKLLTKIERLRVKLGIEHDDGLAQEKTVRRNISKSAKGDDEYHDADADADVDDESATEEHRTKNSKRSKKTKEPALQTLELGNPDSPRTKHLLEIVNSRNLAQIKSLHGFGSKKAQDLVDNLVGPVQTLAELRSLPGMGGRTLERAYEGLVA